MLHMGLIKGQHSDFVEKSMCFTIMQHNIHEGDLQSGKKFDSYNVFVPCKISDDSATYEV